jgi:hypothetical protein
MQLTYRSAHYQLNVPLIEMKPNQAIGVYRGVTFPLSSSKPVKQIQSMIPLKYRGVAYSRLCSSLRVKRSD